LLKQIIVAVLVSLVVVYVSDLLLLRHKMSNPDQKVAFGTITTFYATPTKDGRMEVFTDQPLTETCVHSLFPHSGYRPCWYASRGIVKQF
jgi:hypothetical protein